MTSYYIETEIDNSTLGQEVRFATQDEAQKALKVLLDCREGDGEICTSELQPTTTFAAWCDEAPTW